MSSEIIPTMNEIQTNAFPIGTIVEWHSIPYGIVRGTIVSAPHFRDGMWKYDFNSFNNNTYDGQIYYIPHESYGFTFRAN